MITVSGAPILATERLTLRMPQGSDWPVLRDYAATDRARFTGGPQDLATAWRAFGHMVGHWVLRGYGLFFYADRATGAVLGMAGPWFPEGRPEREIAWAVLDPAAEGKGYALEAALAARDWAYRTLGWQTAVSYIDPANTRSIALATRLGARLDVDAPALEGHAVYRHPAPEGRA